jgi:nucleoid-associated protein YgaU
LKNPNLILPGQTLKIPSIRTKVVLKENEYQVKKGETLWSIAENLYPDSEINHWNTLYRENKSKISNPNLLKSGTILTVPNLNQFAYTPGDTTYLVKKGDSFWSIAQMINNLEPSKIVTWQEIYQLNGDLVTDANTIYPDNLIHLP